jgi:hypothetical protein
LVELKLTSLLFLQLLASQRECWPTSLAKGTSLVSSWTTLLVYRFVLADRSSCPVSSLVRLRVFLLFLSSSQTHSSLHPYNRLTSSHPHTHMIQTHRGNLPFFLSQESASERDRLPSPPGHGAVGRDENIKGPHDFAHTTLLVVLILMTR